MSSPKDVQKSSMESIRLAENSPSPNSQHALAQQSEIHAPPTSDVEEVTYTEKHKGENSRKYSPLSQQTFDEKTSDQYDVEAASLPKREHMTEEEEEAQKDDAEQEEELNQNPKQKMHVSMFSSRGEDKNQPPSKQPGFDDLFFDLLLTACLSVYSNNADLSSASKIGVFIGYFSLLWWSWWSQTLFDVRFRGRDRFGFYMQCGQRLVRSTCLGVWIAFATVSSEFARGGYTNFTTIYVCSRGALIADYLLIIARTYVHKTKFWDDDIPFAVERRERSRISERQCHMIIIGGTLISMALWIASPYVVDNHQLPPAVIGMWIAGIIVELIAEVIVEIFGSLRSISATPIVERLALFSLMVFGNGFENIGQALNLVSPGSRDFDKGGLPVGGWSTLTVLNAVASVIIVTLLFFGYFSRAIKEFVAHPARIMVWCYVHIVLHIASAVLMIGLGKVISYVNTLNALIRFGKDYSLYLPNDEGWLNFINSPGPDQVFNNATIPAPGDIQDYYARTIIEIFATITSLQGAIIPDVNLAQALANSTVPFKDVSLPPAASTAIGNYVNVINGMQQPDSLNQYLSQNAYNFYYAYLCPAIYMFGDIALKLLQHSSDGWRSIERPIIVSQSIRLVFGVILVLVQIGYFLELSKIDPETTAVECCLIILACIMMLESFLQIVLLFMPTFHKIYRRHIRRKRN